jgi:HSP20 family molecular chaperone IbpA
LEWERDFNEGVEDFLGLASAEALAFQRTVPIPRGLRAEAIQATYRDGVLEISAPVEKTHLPKEVKVEVEKSA